MNIITPSPHLNASNSITCTDARILKAAGLGMMPLQNIEKGDINKPKAVDAQISKFLKKYFEDIKEIIKRRFDLDKRQVGDWKELGRGSAKIVYTHPKLTDYVIKFPGTLRDVGNIKRHYDNYLIAKKIIENGHYHHLVLPETHLISSLKWPILIEKRLYFEKGYNFINEIRSASRNQLKDFLVVGDFCDIRVGHNAKYLEADETDPKIGIFDLDCRGNAVGGFF